MNFKEFHDYFPQDSEKEYLQLMVKWAKESEEEDTITLIEMFDDTPDYDCRMVRLKAFSKTEEKVLAIINYGWEEKSFYEKTLTDKDKELFKSLKGPEFDISSPRSDYADKILNIVKDIVKNKQYAEHIKNHYRIFKDKAKSSIVVTI